MSQGWEIASFAAQSMCMSELMIRRAYCGPPRSGNGGYVSGRLASEVRGPCEVMLHAPPPLETELSLSRTAAGQELRHGDTLIASAQPCARLSGALPASVSFSEAKRARDRFVGNHHHMFPNCFVCGTDNAKGLRLHPGATANGQAVACDWVPSEDLADEGEGQVRCEFGWAALDCPGYFGAFAPGEIPLFALLGKISVEVNRWPRVGEPCVVMGWPRRRSGRKIAVGSAIFSAEKSLFARAEATWIQVDPDKFL